MKDSFFGEKLKELRGKAGLSQVALAEKVGTNQQNIARWEAGAVEPVWSNVQALAAALGVTCEAFAVEPEKPKKKPKGKKA